VSQAFLGRPVSRGWGVFVLHTRADFKFSIRMLKFLHINIVNTMMAAFRYGVSKKKECMVVHFSSWSSSNNP
jgi:hypothetical protein